MTVTLDVSSETEVRLAAQAEARGLSLTEYVCELVVRGASEERQLRGYRAYNGLPHRLAEFERECSEEKLRETSL